MTKSYEKCKKCGHLMPPLVYSLSKEDRRKLFKQKDQPCYICYLKEKNLYSTGTTDDEDMHPQIDEYY